MNNKIQLAGAIIASFAASTVLADAPGAGSVSIQSIENNGQGCEPGSVATNISDDGQAMTLLFDDFLVEAGPEVGPRQAKSCNVKVGMKVPSGWSYGLFCVDYRGYAGLDKNVNAKQESFYRFDGSQKIKVGQLDLTGPVDLDYQQLSQIPVNSISWSPCSKGEVKPMMIDTNIEIKTPTPIALNHRQGEKLADDIGDAATVLRVHVRRYERALYGVVNQLRDAGKLLEKQFDKRKPAAEMIPTFKKVKALVSAIQDRIAANAALANNRHVKKYWARVKTPMPALQSMLLPPPADAGGLMTVDSLDGHLKHHYGIAWKRCDPTQPAGGWVQANGRQRCSSVCAAKGKTLGRSPDGAQCASGEARPLSAKGKIQFVKGCWPNCNTQGAITTNVHGHSCYRPGQKKDNDRTDRIVGCFCK